MALPTTAVQVEMMLKAMVPKALNQTYFKPMLDTMVWKMGYSPRAHTDDMRQMLYDMGIDRPEFRPIRFNVRSR